MIYFKEQFAKVWKLERKEKFAVGRISTSEKLQDGTYENSNWNVKLLGKAFGKQLNEGDRIKIISGKVINKSYKDKQGENKNWLEVVVFDFEIQGQSAPSSDSWETDELPF
jgi:hypothetical protein